MDLNSYLVRLKSEKQKPKGMSFSESWNQRGDVAGNEKEENHGGGYFAN